MRNELFAKLLERESIKEVPLVYIIKVFSAIQEMLEEESREQELMDIS